MNPSIERYLKQKDYDKLRFIFLQAVDIDPTFEESREDYETCKREIVQPHKELTPFRYDEASWKDKMYWGQLKLDLKMNFSEERFAHILEVAKVYYADKIAQAEANKKAQKEAVSKEETTNKIQKEIPQQVDDEKRVQKEPVEKTGTYKQTSDVDSSMRIQNPQPSSKATLPKQSAPVQPPTNQPEKKTTPSETNYLPLVILAAVILLLAILFTKCGSKKNQTQNQAEFLPEQSIVLQIEQAL